MNVSRVTNVPGLRCYKFLVRQWTIARIREYHPAVFIRCAGLVLNFARIAEVS